MLGSLSNPQGVSLSLDEKKQHKRFTKTLLFSLYSIFIQTLFSFLFLLFFM